MACLSHLLVPDRNRPTVYTLGFEKYGQQEVHTLAKGTWHLTIFGSPENVGEMPPAESLMN